MPVSRSRALLILLALFFISLFIHRPVSVYAATFNVTTANTTGAGSLRAAIEAANLTPALDLIEFHIPGSGVHTITLMTELPDIIYPVTITAETEEGWVAATASTPASLRVELTGPSLLNDYLKFAEGSDGSTIKGLSITAHYMGIYLRSDNNRCV